MRLEGARILVVDDNLELAENLDEILTFEGAVVSHAKNASEALKLAQRGFEIALVDVRLPDDTGLNLTPKLRALSNAAVEVLLITGNASIDDAIDAVKRGAYDYLLKPFDAEKLVASVARAFRQCQLARETATLHAALADSEASLRTLVDGVQALLLELDINGTILRANRSVLRLLGRKSVEVVGKNWCSDLHRPDDRIDLEAALKAAREGQMPTESLLRERRVACSREETGRECWVAWHLAPIALECGETRIYASGADVTELRELERRTRLNEKLAAVGTLAAGLAHEIRNPLNSIGLQMQLLSRRLHKITEDNKLIDPICAVEDEIRRLSRLVEDFLRFARPSDLRAKSFDLVAVAEQIVGFEHVGAEKLGVSLRLHRPEAQVELSGDVEKLRQVFVNLISNGVDAAGPSGCVDVYVEATVAGGRVRVEDSGPGIPEELLARIFEPFFSTKEHGTGLGMAICHSLIALHGGEIKIVTHPRTSVVVELPRNPPTQLGAQAHQGIASLEELYNEHRITTAPVDS